MSVRRLDETAVSIGGRDAGVSLTVTASRSGAGSSLRSDATNQVNDQRAMLLGSGSEDRRSLQSAPRHYYTEHLAPSCNGMEVIWAMIREDESGSPYRRGTLEALVWRSWPLLSKRSSVALIAMLSGCCRRLVDAALHLGACSLCAELRRH